MGLARVHAGRQTTPKAHLVDEWDALYELVFETKIEVQEEDTSWRCATLYRHRQQGNVVLWFGGTEYEGLETVPGYSFDVETNQLCDGNGDQI